MHHFHLQVSRNNVVLAILTDYQVSDVFKYLIHAKAGYLWFKKKQKSLSYLSAQELHFTILRTAPIRKNIRMGSSRIY